jgi:hypothetical protein
MTKAVRIENADMSDYKVMVQVWQKQTPVGEESPPDILLREVVLDAPTSLATEFVWSRQYLVIKQQ